MASTETPRSALYETILSQPDVVRAVLDGAGADAERAAGILAGARRVFLAGTGNQQPCRGGRGAPAARRGRRRVRHDQLRLGRLSAPARRRRCARRHQPPRRQALRRAGDRAGPRRGSTRGRHHRPELADGRGPRS